MTNRDDRREVLLDRMADHLLRVGLAGASLRPLAAAAGTSDRMLLYYFVDRDELLAATLGQAAGRMAALLAAAVADAGPWPFAEALAGVWAIVRADPVRPFMRLWFELAARAARGEAPYQVVARQIADGFLLWAAGRLEVADEADRAGLAALLVATIDGLALLDAVDHAAAAEAALRARP